MITNEIFKLWDEGRYFLGPKIRELIPMKVGKLDFFNSFKKEFNNGNLKVAFAEYINLGSC